jgi:predicted transposase/invertase (TIGR01784 family)
MPADDDPIHHAHDKLFKAGFGDPATAAAFLRAELPAALAATIHWPTLRIETGSFIDSQFRRSESDLLFSAAFGDEGAKTPALIYILFEHQVKEEPLLALRLLRYMLRIWENWRKSNQQADRLPPIIPVVLAQNAEPWSGSPRFLGLIDLPADLAEEMRPFIPDFSFQLVELATRSYTALPGTPAGIMILRTMKAQRASELLTAPVWDEPLLAQLPSDIHELLLRYILASEIDIPAFDRRVKMLHQKDLKQRTMTLADQLIEQGRQESFQALREGIMALLEARFGLLPTGLSEAIEAIENLEQLRVLQRRAISCGSAEEFIAAF